MFTLQNFGSFRRTYIKKWDQLPITTNVERTITTNVMKTIEKLCKYKDVVDIVYWQVHKLLIKQLNDEYKKLSTVKYSYEDYYDDYYFPLDYYFPVGNLSCFNWRSLPDPGCVIFHISHATQSITKTHFCTYWHYWCH